MDEQLIARLFFFILISTAVRGQNITNDQNETRLELSEVKLTWDGVKQSCDSLAGESFFCNDNDTKCTPELADHFDTSNLPEVFTAWIDSYLVDSFTVTFIGCYEALKAHFFTEVRGTEDFEMCVLACDSRFDYIGWLEKTCYCVMDVLVSIVSTSSILLSINHCNGENRPGNGTVMNLYRRHETYSLVTDHCPVAYYFGNVYFVSGIVNCDQKKSFICNNSDIEFDEDTWSNAVQKCTNMSSRLSYQPELKEVLKKKRDTGAFWLQGSNVNKLAFDGYKAEQTRCTALEKDYSGRMKFIVLNCSSELPGLCVNQLKMIEETFFTTEESLTEEDTTTDYDNINTTSVQTVDNESSTESTHSFLTDVMYPLTTNVIEEEHNYHTLDNNDTETIGIGAGVVAVAICAIVFFVCYYRRKKKQTKESISKKPKFKNYEVTSVCMLPQTLRYLPVSVAYPAEYGVKDIKDTHTKLDDAEGEQMETNATVHSEDDIDIGHEHTLDREKHIVTDDLEECVVENNLHENHTNESALSVLHPGNLHESNTKASAPNVSHPGNLHESSTNASSPSASLHDNDERSNTRSNVHKDDDRYIAIRVSANLENTNDAEDQYVSMVIVPNSSIKDQVDRRSIEGQTNVTVDHTIKDQVDLSKNSGGTDSTTSTKNNREEVEIATLRELIHDDNIDSDVYVELSSDSNRGDRIDSTVFKLFDED